VLPSTDRAEARACFKEAAAINPSDPRVWQALAKLADTTAEAVDAFRELVRVAPDQPHGRFALRNALAADARSLAEAGRTEDARARWQEIVSMSNSDVEAWLGVAATTSNEQEAIQAIETAHRLSPANEQVIEARARLERSKIDPATVEAPFDAFARFDGPAQPAPSADDPFAQLDSTLDAFATPAQSTAVPAPAPAPAARMEAPAAVSSSPDPISDLAAALENAAAAHQAEAAITIDFDSALASQPPAAQAAEVVLAAPAGSPASDDPFLIPEPNLGDRLLAAQEIAAAGTPQSPATDHQPQVTDQTPAAVPPAPATAPQVPVTEQPAVAQAADATTPAAEKPKPASYASSRKTVMIVDDSPTIRKILGLTLERAGYKVVAEPDGESAIERLVQVVPDVILLDIAMPKIDGYEVCKRIKADPRTKAVPVVMLSGKGALFDKVKGHMAGATEYLTKPFETPAVLAVVANYCEKTAEVVNG
jgi:CheY-like chemotaxis protein